ncbi:MAG: hypothetical protein K8R11_07135 [Methanococcoides sp.]|nr:hypothetical protein [Methanococcoides sp.]
MTFKPYTTDFDILKCIAEADQPVRQSDVIRLLELPGRHVQSKPFISLKRYKMIDRYTQHKSVYLSITPKGRVFLATKEAVMKIRQV